MHGANILNRCGHIDVECLHHCRNDQPKVPPVRSGKVYTIGSNYCRCAALAADGMDENPAPLSESLAYEDYRAWQFDEQVCAFFRDVDAGMQYTECAILCRNVVRAHGKHGADLVFRNEAQ
jgi:hypothetical protein